MKRALVLAVVVLVLAAAPGSAQTTGPVPPNAFLASSSGEVEGEFRAYCWTKTDSTGAMERICADWFGSIDPAVALTVEAGEPLTLRFDRPISPSSITVLRRDSPSSLPVRLLDIPAGNPTVFTLDLPPGTHFLTVSTWWGHQDDATYEFEVDIQPASSIVCRPGHGRGDRKHCHTGPPGRAINGAR